MKNKKPLIWICALVAAALIMFGLYKAFGPKPAEGSKSVTVEVVNDEGAVKTYSAKTDAEYFRGVMDELKASTDFTYEGNESDFGLYITSVNGLEAVYDDNGAYWALYINGEYGQYGADQQPVTDGDTYRLAYEIYE